MRKSTLSGKLFVVNAKWFLNKFFSYCREFSMQIVARIALGYKHVQQFQNNLVQMALGVIAGFGRSIFCHLSWMFPKLSFPFGKLGMLVEIFGCLSFVRLLLTVRSKVVERKAVSFHIN